MIYNMSVIYICIVSSISMAKAPFNGLFTFTTTNCFDAMVNWSSSPRLC